MERLRFTPDGVRIEHDEAEAKKTHDRLSAAYEAFGYTLTYVPLMSISERTDFILKQVSLLEGNYLP